MWDVLRFLVYKCVWDVLRSRKQVFTEQLSKNRHKSVYRSVSITVCLSSQSLNLNNFEYSSSLRENMFSCSYGSHYFLRKCFKNTLFSRTFSVFEELIFLLKTKKITYSSFEQAYYHSIFQILYATYDFLWVNKLSNFNVFFQYKNRTPVSFGKPKRGFRKAVYSY